MTLKAILLDSREPPWVQGLGFGDVPVSVDALTAGDAWLLVEDATIVVERKTFSDLLSSIQDEGLFDQAARMVKLSSWRYLVVQGRGYLSQDGERLSHAGGVVWNVHRVEGALATVQQMGVAVVRIGAQPHNYHAALLWLAGRKRGEVKVAPRREAVMQSPGERLLCALPGIDEVLAQALLKHCSTAAWSLVYLAGEGGGKVPGIGPVKKEATKQALGLEDNQTFEIHIKEATSE